MRGKLPTFTLTQLDTRLIPACAGKTWSMTTSGAGNRAHPRVCGENGSSQLRALAGRGSSPRVRGKLSAKSSRSLCLGLIPACAGKTPGRRCASRARRAHPRVCGENSPIGGRLSLLRGSSPRVRGKLTVSPKKLDRPGLIPACAGKTPYLLQRTCQRRAHPRVCGENGDCPAAAVVAAGSSPRVRGKPGHMRINKKTLGLIPACAGKTRDGG